MQKKRLMKVLMTTLLAVGLLVTPANAQTGVRNEREPNNTQQTANLHNLQIPYFDRVVIAGTLNNPIDKDDWIRVKLDSEPKRTGVKQVRFSFEFRGTKQATYKVTLWNERNGKVGEKIVKPNESMYESRIFLKDNESLYVHVHLVDGNPIEAYRMDFEQEHLYYQ